MPKRVLVRSYVPRKRTRRTYPRRTKRMIKRALRSKGYALSTKVYSYCRYASQFANVQRVNLSGGTDPWLPSSNQFYVPTGNASAEINAVFVPNFADLKNVTEFSNLYDRYMLIGVKYMFRLVTNPNTEHNTGSSSNTQTLIGNNTFPELWACADYDDSAAITRSQIQEYQNVRRRVLQPNRVTSIYLAAPRVKTGALDASTVKASVMAKPYQWIDMAQTTIDHFGLKIVICAPTPTVNLNPDFNVHVEAKYYFKCKDVR